MFNRTTVLVTALTLFLVACGGTTNTTAPKTPNPETPTSQKQASIRKVGWTLENRDPSWSTSGNTAFLRASIYFTDTTLEASDFASIEISDSTDRDIVWTFDEEADFEDNFNSENDVFRTNLVHSSQDDGSVIPLGTYTFEAKLKNGRSATKALLVSAPGSTAAAGKNFGYTENYSGATNAPSNFVALPKRAAVESAVLDLQASNISVAFSVTDDTIYSGWLWFYDSAGDYVGYSYNFRNYKTGVLMEQLNEGASLFTDGATNTVTLAASAEQLSLEENKTLSDIASISVVLTDGGQYVDVEDTYGYDTWSRTGKLDVSVNQ